MNGRIVRPDHGASMLELPEIGRLHIGMKTKNQNGKEIPTSVDYFIPAGKYAELFKQALGEKPNTVAIIFPDDDPAKVCNERYTYRDDDGRLVARGDGMNFEIWNGKEYAPYSVAQYPDIMQQVAEKQPNKRVKAGKDGWDVELTMRFIVPAVRGIVGVWAFNTKGAASTIPNIRKSFDSVQVMRGTVTNTAFDLSVKFAKSNKPGDNSRFPVVELIANDNRIEQIRAMLQPQQKIAMLLPEPKE